MTGKALSQGMKKAAPGSLSPKTRTEAASNNQPLAKESIMSESTIAQIPASATLEPAWGTMTAQQAQHLAVTINSLYPAWPVDAVWDALKGAAALHEGDNAATVALAMFNFATDERNLDVGGFRFPGEWWDTARTHTASTDAA